jgi:hypothetical protein
VGGAVLEGLRAAAIDPTFSLVEVTVMLIVCSEIHFFLEEQEWAIGSLARYCTMI